MPDYDILVGDRVDVLRNANLQDEDERQTVLTSKVIDIVDDITLKLSMPMDKSVTVPLTVGEEDILYFYKERWILASRAVVRERFYEGALPVVQMELITEPEKIQRRRFYRLDYTIDVQFHVLTNDELREVNRFSKNDRATLIKLYQYIEYLSEHAENWAEGTLLDLSGGGARLISGEELDREKLILMALKLKTGESINEYNVLMEIMNSYRKHNVTGKFESRTRFFRLMDSYRDAIVRFIFEEERIQRSRLVEEEE